jgi:hypothetical protein
MLPGFEKIVEERILKAQKRGEFDNLPGAGLPLKLEDDGGVAEDLRLAYKILKNADCLPPEIALRKEILQTQDLLAGVESAAEKFRLLKKLNFLVLKLNAGRQVPVHLEAEQHYFAKLTERMERHGRPPAAADRKPEP